mmetsp:Transcript_72461/g.125655  ORF Transcript_72461/g.125655 Transcript_72461/m.125655 type:complete len:749 (-) Transcript_72461:39-2285(-)
MDIANGCQKIFVGGGEGGYLSLSKSSVQQRTDSRVSNLESNTTTSDTEGPAPLASPAAQSSTSLDSAGQRYSAIPAPRQRSSSVCSAGPEEPRVSLCSAWAAGKLVINPQANQYLPVWDGFIVALLIVVSLWVPYRVAFHFGSDEAGHYVWLYHGNELIFVLDMALQFFVSSPDPVNHRWIRMPPFIVSFYIRTSLLTDTMSVLPYGSLLNSISRFADKDLRGYSPVKLLHLLKLRRVSRLTARYSTRVGVPYAASKLTKLFVLLVLALHWLSCCWGLILSLQRFSGINIGDTWADVLRETKPGMFKDAQVERPWELYSASLYWSCMTITSIGYGDISASNTLEAWCCIVLMAACGLMWANIIGSICALASALDAENVMHENRLDSLNTMLHNFDIPKEDRMRLREYFMRSKVLYHRSHQVELMKCMSPEIQGMVARFVQKNIMNKVFFLEDKSVSDGFVVGLFERFQFAVYPPRELVRLRRSMVCLRTGVALLKARILSAGSIWGIEDMVISNKELLQNYTPLALSYLELQFVTRSSLKELIGGFPNEEKIIRKGAVWLALRTSLLRHVVKPSWVDLDQTPKFRRSPGRKSLDEVEPESPQAGRFERQTSRLSTSSIRSLAFNRRASEDVGSMIASAAARRDSTDTGATFVSHRHSMLDGQQALEDRSQRLTLEGKLKEALRLLEGSLIVHGGDLEGAVESKITQLHELMQNGQGRTSETAWVKEQLNGKVEEQVNGSKSVPGKSRL